MTPTAWQSTPRDSRRRAWPAPIASTSPPRCGCLPRRASSRRGTPSTGSLKFEGHAETARQGAKDVTEKAMTFAEQNIASTFEFTQALLRAKDLQDVMKLQADYFRRQMQMFTEQARELGESTSKAARDATTP